MRILDESGNVLDNPNLDEGYLVPEQLFVAEHPEVPAQREEFHYETTYENEVTGEREVQKVVDSPAVDYQPAWTEYEDIERYHLFTPEEKVQHMMEVSLPSAEQRVQDLEYATASLVQYVANLDAKNAEYIKEVDQHNETSQQIAADYDSVKQTVKNLQTMIGHLSESIANLQTAVNNLSGGQTLPTAPTTTTEAGPQAESPAGDQHTEPEEEQEDPHAAEAHADPETTTTEDARANDAGDHVDGGDA